jgi:amino acid transporter
MDMSMNFDGELLMDFFVSMLLIGIGVALLATGIFTSYFGAGKSQKIGFALLISGIAILAYFIVLYPLDENTFIEALVSGVSVLSGMIIGMFVILFVLMKVDTVDDLEDLDLEDLEDLDLDEELKKLEEELNQADDNSEDEE